jgi:hypothetical protein
VAGATTSKRRNCLFRLKKPIRPVPALPAYAYQEASSLVLANKETRPPEGKVVVTVTVAGRLPEKRYQEIQHLVEQAGITGVALRFEHSGV